MYVYFGLHVLPPHVGTTSRQTLWPSVAFLFTLCNRLSLSCVSASLRLELAGCLHSHVRVSWEHGLRPIRAGGRPKSVLHHTQSRPARAFEAHNVTQPPMGCTYWFYCSNIRYRPPLPTNIAKFVADDPMTAVSNYATQQMCAC